MVHHKIVDENTIEWYVRAKRQYIPFEARICVADFNGAAWMLSRYEADGSLHYSSEWMNVDPETHAHLRAIAEENARDAHLRPEAVNEALNAALQSRRNAYRDDTRDDVILLGTRRAKQWLKMLQSV